MSIQMNTLKNINTYSMSESDVYRCQKDDPRTKIIEISVTVIGAITFIQINQKELIKIFMMISN